MQRSSVLWVVVALVAVVLVGCGQNAADGGGTPDITVLFEGSVIADSSTQDLGDALAGSLSPGGTFTIRNDGDGTLSVTVPVSISVTGPGNIVASSQPLEAIDPGSTSDFLVQIESTGTSGPVPTSGTLTIVSDDPDEGSFEVQLDGNVYY